MKDKDLHRRPPAIFASRLAAWLSPYMTNLPEGFDSAEEKFFLGIFRLLRDLERTHFLLTQLEYDLKKLVGRESEKNAVAYEALLRAYERRIGMNVVRVTKPLSLEETMAFLAAGNTFVDLAGHALVLSLGPGLQAPLNRWRHLAGSHRLQMHLVLRDLLLRPEHYGSPKDPLELLKKLGDPELHRRLDWSQTGLQGENPDQHNLFTQLFDTWENNASSPGFFHEYHAYWPMLPLR